MPLVNQYQASKIAGVTRQTIHGKSKQVPRPAYFVQVTSDKKGTPYINTDHPVWKAYMETSKARRGYDIEQGDRFNKLLAAVVEAIKERFELEDQELNDFLDLINKHYEEG